MMRIIPLALAFTLALFAAQSASAQTRTGPNGGMVAGASGHEIELVIAPAQITIFMMDHGQPASARNATVRAVIQTGQQTATVQLVAGEGNRMTGQLAAPLAKGARVVISGRMADGDNVSARFVVP